MSKNQPTATVATTLSWKPCSRYTRARIKELWAGREALSALDGLDLAIPAEDRLWFVLRPHFIPEPALWELACRFVEAALAAERVAGREPDPRSWAVVETRRRWLRDEATDEEMAAAGAAAVAAAWAAARAAAGAARDAAWAAARAAAWDARAAAGDAQIETVRALLLEAQP